MQCGCKVQDLPGHAAHTQPGIRKLSMDLAAAALKPGPGSTPQGVIAASTQLIFSGEWHCPAAELSSWHLIDLCHVVQRLSIVLHK